MQVFKAAPGENAVALIKLCNMFRETLSKNYGDTCQTKTKGHKLKLTRI